MAGAINHAPQFVVAEVIALVDLNVAVNVRYTVAPLLALLRPGRVAQPSAAVTARVARLGQPVDLMHEFVSRGVGLHAECTRPVKRSFEATGHPRPGERLQPESTIVNLPIIVRGVVEFGEVERLPSRNVVRVISFSAILRRQIGEDLVTDVMDSLVENEHVNSIRYVGDKTAVGAGCLAELFANKFPKSLVASKAITRIQKIAVVLSAVRFTTEFVIETLELTCASVTGER